MPTSQPVENVWDILVNIPSKIDDLKAKSDLMMRLEIRLNALEGDIAQRLGISENRLADLQNGRINEFQLLELQAIARRAGIKP